MPGRNRKNIFVWLPQHSLERFSRIETKRAVLVMGCVEVAARKERPHAKDHRPVRLADEFPAKHDGGLSMWDEQFLLHAQCLGNPPCPSRPPLVRESRQPARAIGMHDIRRIALRRQCDRTARRLDKGIETVDQHHAPGRRSRRAE